MINLHGVRISCNSRLISLAEMDINEDGAPVIKTADPDEVLPTPRDMTWRKVPYKDTNIYLGACGVFHHYFAYKGPGRGFGGASFELTMEDDTTEVLQGPGSSREGVVNLAYPNIMDQIMEVWVNDRRYFMKVEMVRYLAPRGTYKVIENKQFRNMEPYYHLEYIDA